MLKLKDILSHEGLSNLLSVATYGNSWAYIKIKRSEMHLAEEDKYDCREDKWASILLNGGTLMVHDAYEEEETFNELTEEYVITRYPLDLKAVKKGLRLMKEQYPRHWADLVEENDDLITGDVWLQLAIFGELVYS